MCGIIGFLDKRGRQDFPVGQTLYGMLQALSCRGPDSAGVAIYGGDSHPWLRLSGPDGSDPEAFIKSLRKLGIAVHRHYRNGVYDAMLSKDADVENLEDQLQLLLPGTEVICLGKQLNLFKQIGSPQELESTYKISELKIGRAHV